MTRVICTFYVVITVTQLRSIDTNYEDVCVMTKAANRHQLLDFTINTNPMMAYFHLYGFEIDFLRKYLNARAFVHSTNNGDTINITKLTK